MALTGVFQKGDLAQMAKSKKAKDFTLPEGHFVKIIAVRETKEKADRYLYTIETHHPKTNEPVILKDWAAQSDLRENPLWKRVKILDNRLERLEKQMNKSFKRFF